MRKWPWVIGGLFVVGALGHYLAEYDPTNPYLSQPPDKIIEQARALDKKWIESNTPNHKGFIVVANEEVEHARAGLHSIKLDAPQFAEAQRLLADLQHQEEFGKRAMQVAIVKSVENNIEGRKEFIRIAENNFLKNSIDVALSASGPKSTILHFRYVLLSRPFLYKLANETDFLKNCRRVGFTQVHYAIRRMADYGILCG